MIHLCRDMSGWSMAIHLFYCIEKFILCNKRNAQLRARNKSSAGRNTRMRKSAERMFVLPGDGDV